MRLGEDVFAFTPLKMRGQDAVWVMTPQSDNSATLSWRLL